MIREVARIELLLANIIIIIDGHSMDYDSLQDLSMERSLKTFFLKRYIFIVNIYLIKN